MELLRAVRCLFVDEAIAASLYYVCICVLYMYLFYLWLLCFFALVFLNLS